MRPGHATTSTAANEPAPAEQLHEEADEAAIVKMPKATGTAQMVSSR